MRLLMAVVNVEEAMSKMMQKSSPPIYDGNVGTTAEREELDGSDICDASSHLSKLHPSVAGLVLGAIVQDLKLFLLREHK